MTAWLEFGLSNALAATALAALALAVTRFARRPRWAFAAWMLVFAKLLAPPLVSLPLPTLRPHVQTPETGIASAWTLPPLGMETDEGTQLRYDSASFAPGQGFDASVAADFTPIELGTPPGELEATNSPLAVTPAGFLVATWLTVSACWLAVAVARMARFVRVLSRAQAASPALEREVRALAGRLGVRRVPRVKIVKRRLPPLVWALFGRPVILLPAGLLRMLSPQQRTTLLVHELVHLKRRDHLARLLELAALCLYWWHPVAWWARRGAERAAEQCCDAEVVAHLPRAARAYAEALVTTVDYLSEARWPLPAGANGFSEASHVKRRLEMILQAAPVRRPVRSIRLLLLAAGLAALPLSLRSLWAEPAEPPDAPAAESAEEPAAVDEAQHPATQLESRPASASSKEADSIEHRLDRLEKMIESLAAQKQPGQAAPAPKRVKSDNDETPVDSPVDLEHEFADVRKQAKLNLELAETGYWRKMAAARQLAALKAAYRSDTVAIDQLLEAQRRLAEAETSYAQVVCDLCANSERQKRLRPAARLAIVNKAIHEARQTWELTNARFSVDSAESKAEAQAREQYYQFKSQRKALLEQFQQTEPGTHGSRSQTHDLQSAYRLRWLTDRVARHPETLGLRKELAQVRHFELQVAREKQKLEAAREKLKAARNQAEKGEASGEDMRQLEQEVAALERRVNMNLMELTAAKNLLDRRTHGQ